VASSAYYSVCCLDECESILGQLEQRIAAPEEKPGVITSLISMIPSATMPSTRSLSPWLHQRLDEVAKHHGGVVPLHGRLFAQWLHYAYPRECQFPHVSGTINPQRPEDVIREANATDEVISASEEEMKRHIEAAPPKKHRVPGADTDASEESAMWSLDEELVVWRPARKDSVFDNFSIYGKGLAASGALLSLCVALVRSLLPALRNLQGGGSDKYFV
jgi:hypothetical protein